MANESGQRERRGSRKRRAGPRYSLAFLFLTTLANAGCQCGGSTHPAGEPALLPGAGDIPESLAVVAGSMTSGFAIGNLKSTVDVGPFRISKTVITVSQYARCVESRGCTPPARLSLGCTEDATGSLRRSTFGLRDKAPELPVTCTEPSQAVQYCAWVGGALPTLEQWQFAARGPDVHRFAWGNDAPSCDRHPLTIDADPSPCCDGCELTQQSAVRQRPLGASPSGLLDVLLTESELLRASPDARVPACSGTSGNCLVTGIVPAAIDGVRSVDDNVTEDSPEFLSPTFGFRCVWTEG